ncbi:ECF transporter S component [Streptococcus sp. E17BB]|uniref:ECF transporter S component n=1 Tax=Streptococcus sp. E17BB TaxID=3278714 RepID=UPI00359D095D
MLNTRRLTFIAILGALSFVLMFFSFPIIPGADFLKVELSVLPVLLGLFLMDVKAAYQILILRTVLKLLLNNHGVNDVIGLPMNIVALGLFVTCFAVFTHRRQSTKSLLLAGGIGTLSLTVAMLFLNYVYAMPLYATFANFDIAKHIGTSTYLVGMVLPFNLVQGALFTLATVIILLPHKRLFRRIMDDAQ